MQKINKSKQNKLWSVSSCRKKWDEHRKEQETKKKIYMKNKQNCKLL